MAGTNVPLPAISWPEFCRVGRGSPVLRPVVLSGKEKEVPANEVLLAHGARGLAALRRTEEEMPERCPFLPLALIPFIGVDPP